jgi:transposase
MRIPISDLNRMQLTCKSCGTVIEQPLASIRPGILKCPICDIVLQGDKNLLANLAKVVGEIQASSKTDNIEVNFVDVPARSGPARQLGTYPSI